MLSSRPMAGHKSVDAKGAKNGKKVCKERKVHSIFVKNSALSTRHPAPSTYPSYFFAPHLTSLQASRRLIQAATGRVSFPLHKPNKENLHGNLLPPARFVQICRDGQGQQGVVGKIHWLLWRGVR